MGAGGVPERSRTQGEPAMAPDMAAVILRMFGRTGFGVIPG